MKEKAMRKMLVAVAALLAVGYPILAHAADDWSKVAAALGKPGTIAQGGVYRVGLPRSDLHVSVDGIVLKPTLALGGWLAFKKMGNEAMVMGDLVLTEDEVNAVMTPLEESGIEITALHNHLLSATPNTMYMHVFGQGDPVRLASILHEALAASRTPLQAPPAGASQPAGLDLDTAALDQALGAKGKIAGGVYQFSIPRSDAINDGGMAVPPAMGSANAINFQPLGGGKAAIAGDLVLTAQEVNPVLRTLRENGIEVTAVHNHMLEDQPHVFFMHFWAHDDAIRLAKGMRAALDKTAILAQ
jgi:biotin operon repressor